MAISTFKYTKSWINPTDFPTYEDNETQVRADMQILYDEIRDYINGVLLTNITGTAGASNIGTSTGQSVEDALADRYTKLEADTRTNVETKDLVKDWSVDLDTGIITITKKDGTTSTFDTALEKVPAKFEIIESDSVWYLKITNVDGTFTQTDVTNLMNIYSFTNSDTVAFTTTGTGNEKDVTAAVRENSITLDMLALDAITQLQTWVNQTQANAEAAALSETNADAYADSALVSANTATARANEAQTYAESANTSRLSASTSADQAEASATTASSKAIAASNSATLANSYAKGGTGTRTGEDTDNAKYYMEQARKIVGAEYATAEDVATAKQEAITTANSNANTYVYMHNESNDAHTTLFAKKADGLVYNNGQLQLQANGENIGMPVDIAIGGIINAFVSGYKNGSYTATSDTNSFTIDGFLADNTVTLIHDNLFLVRGTDFSVDNTGVVTLAYTLPAEETIYWILHDTSYDANDLSNKTIFVLAEEKAAAGGVATLGDDGELDDYQLPSVIDCGSFSETLAIALHAEDEYAHSVMAVDGTANSVNTSAETLDQHEADENAHTNLILDGNNG